jgi:hypothetical protein
MLNVQMTNNLISDASVTSRLSLTRACTHKIEISMSNGCQCPLSSPKAAAAVADRRVRFGPILL